MALKMRSSATKSVSITPTQSTTLVKNLFRAAFSSIAFLRNFFDDDCFQVGTIGSTKYHKIVGAQKEDVLSFIDWFEKGVFDALQNKYLQVVLLQVFERDPKAKNKGKKVANPQPKHLLECFSFYVTYTKDGSPQLCLAGSDGATSRPQDTRDAVKKNASEVLRSLVEMTSTLRPLPKHRILSIKLLYTPETPANYEPPLFTTAAQDEKCWFDEEPMRVRVGKLKTPYHQVSMGVRVRATQENKEGGVLQAREADEMEVDTGEEGLVDVGGSQANSGRVAPARREPLKESQMADACDDRDGHRMPVTLRVRGAEEKAGGAGSRSERRGSRKRGADSAGTGSPASRWTSSRRRKLSSTVKEKMEQ